MATVSKLQIVLEATTTAFDNGLKKATVSLQGFAKKTDEIQRLRNGKHAQVRPTLNYRVYLSSVLGLEITDNQPQDQGAVFKCKAKETNATATGTKYTIDSYPRLRGFL